MSQHLDSPKAAAQVVAPQHLHGQPIDIQQFITRVHQAIATQFPVHPYATGVTRENFETVISNYLAMSLAFPYLQAGAVHRVFEHYFRNGMDIARDVELTSVVGTFLCWDEMGGHSVALSEGNAGLPHILETKRFHANLLRSDVRFLLGKDVTPAWTDTTRQYLLELSYGLSSVDPVTRISYMVGFEKHAEDMISALWQSTISIFEADKDRLSYFHGHVGGDDPAEAYHVQMTGRMITDALPQEEEQRLFTEILKAYRLNYEWCQAVTRLGSE